MKRFLGWTLASALLLSAGWLVGAEVSDLATTDANNTNASYGFPEGMAPSSVNDNARAFQGMVARWYQDTDQSSLVSGGITGAITLTPNRTISALTDGLLFGFELGTGVTGSTTLNVSSIGAKTLKKNGDQNLSDGDADAGDKVVVVYDGTNDTFQVLAGLNTLIDPMTTRGDLVYRDSSNSTARLALGGDGAVLSSDGTDASWSTTASSLGKQTIWVPAGAMKSTASNGAASLASEETTAGQPDINYLAFDNTADEHAQFSVTFPKGWDEGTVSYIPYWAQAATVSGDVTWFLQGVALDDNNAFGTAYGTAVTVGDTAHQVTEGLMIGPESSAITIGNTPSEGDVVIFRVGRDVSDNDNFSADAWLTGVKVLYTLDAASDD